MEQRSVRNVAIIGSFRRHYATVLEAHAVFNKAGWTITSPVGSATVGTGTEEFVRFESDCEDWSDEMIETVALHRILRADLTYAICPDGYVGRTTAYEIGRLIQAGRRIIFSEMPRDVPLGIGIAHVLSPGQLTRLRLDTIPVLHRDWPPDRAELEQALVRGEFREI
jgi:hypothetical protein